MADIKYVSLMTKNLTKKGVLKGKNKKETKILRGSCVHHFYSKKHKLKAAPWRNSGTGKCSCPMCNHEFRAKFYRDDELPGIINPYVEFVDQAKYIAVAANLGEKTIAYWADLGGKVALSKKMYKKSRNVAQKQSKMKKKKNKNFSGQQRYGSWGKAY